MSTLRPEISGGRTLRQAYPWTGCLIIINEKCDDNDVVGGDDGDDVDAVMRNIN